jgi:hypothetical protein
MALSSNYHSVTVMITAFITKLSIKYGKIKSGKPTESYSIAMAMVITTHVHKSPKTLNSK